MNCACTEKNLRSLIFSVIKNLCVFVYIWPPRNTGGAVVDGEGAFALFNQSLASFRSEWTSFFCFRHFRIRSVLFGQLLIKPID